VRFLRTIFPQIVFIPECIRESQSYSVSFDIQSLYNHSDMRHPSFHGTVLTFRRFYPILMLSDVQLAVRLNSLSSSENHLHYSETRALGATPFPYTYFNLSKVPIDFSKFEQKCHADSLFKMFIAEFRDELSKYCFS
jgi:hypothetical protein